MSKIHSSLESLQGVSEKIARFIIENAAEISGKPLNELAQKAGVSEASIVRFYKKMGFKHYRDFLLSLAFDSNDQAEALNEEIEVEDNAQLVMAKLIGATEAILNEQVRVTDFSKVETAVDRILQAKRIAIYGSGGNGPLAFDAHHHFIKLGKACEIHTDPYMQLMSAAMLTPDDVALVIIHPRDVEDANFVMEVAGRKGAYRIAVTSQYESALSKLVELMLYTPYRESVFRGEPLSSRYAVLHLLDTLYITMAIRQQEIAGNIASVQELLREKNQKMKGTFKN
ncbi:MurR/RpiR family transcriptional regulator [Brevibacillus sp. B_LB10_24]|uniref:MurR/RpiR family transcriptional regulator n=1 Tax=Brevibacillus sp. B_LB10_24 TaxID=3380645 RepID=UPI0038BCCC0D